MPAALRPFRSNCVMKPVPVLFVCLFVCLFLLYTDQCCFYSVPQKHKISLGSGKKFLLDFF